MSLQKPTLSHPVIIYSFLMIGITSAIAFRVITILQNFNPVWVRPAWYTGVIGYMLFFLYRYYISIKRKKAVEKYNLIKKVQTNACLTDEDRQVVIYLLNSIHKSPENINYLIIFILSCIAIAVDLYLTF
ncbi:MAG: hypothetical protein N3A59_00665 [Thermodesulfovibrionales bacterium]|nr:hypothetical protein [Thermodesulfovibrionales bacterium]